MSVITVLGEVKPESLGRTLTHEHMHMEFTHFYREPPKQLSGKFINNINIQNSTYIRQYPYSCKYNLVLDDKDSLEAVTYDVEEYKKFGGGTIVENTTEGLKRNIDFMKHVSKKTGVHVIAGTGYYISDVQSNKNLSATKEELYKHMKTELLEGCIDHPSVRAGFMGEIASVWPIKDFEKKAIEASGEVQAEVGCGVSFHPHREPAAPFEIIRRYLEAGGRADRAVMSHLERTLLKDEELLEFAKLGTYCQFDLFGLEVSFYQLNAATDMPSDAQRLDKVKLLIDEGYLDRITISHDIHTKHRLTPFGGHGYAHIINNIIPRMEAKGISKQAIEQITIRNPANWLTIRK